MIKNALMQSSTPLTNGDGSTDYVLSKDENNHTTLHVQSDGTWELTELQDGTLRFLATITPEGYAAVKSNNSFDDSQMIAGNISSVYKGEMKNFTTYQGIGTRYESDGFIDYGKWNENRRNSMHYIYNPTEEYTAVTQYKEGTKHGISSFHEFNSEHIYTRVYKDNELNGHSLTRYLIDGYYAEVMNYYEDNEKLPLIYINYPDLGLKRMVIGTEEESIEIYDSETYDRLFIAEFENKKPNGFGYTRYGDVEYIGQLDGFDILGDGYYYNVDDEENIFDKKVDAIISNIIRDDMTDREKILKVHDYIINNVTYHKPNIDVSLHPGATHTAYGALVDNSAVCDGYAQAFKVLIDELGFENHLIFGITKDATGEFSETSRHAWNILEYNGKYSHFDPTWNDPTYSDKIRHKYYFMDSDEIKEDHKWDEDDYEKYLSPSQ